MGERLLVGFFAFCGRWRAKARSGGTNGQWCVQADGGPLGHGPGGEGPGDQGGGDERESTIFFALFLILEGLACCGVQTRVYYEFNGGASEWHSSNTSYLWSAKVRASTVRRGRYLRVWRTKSTSLHMCIQYVCRTKVHNVQR